MRQTSGVSPLYNQVGNNRQNTFSPSSTRDSDDDGDEIGAENASFSTSKQQRQWAIALFSVCTVLLFADQNLMSPNLTAIAKDFGFSDEERDRKLGGQIALAFFVLGAPASFIVGCLGDTYDRAHLFAWTVGIGEGACLATFFCQTFPQLYVCRAITGFSLGGAVPLMYSVMGDLFAADDRHSVSAILSIGTGAGISLGQGISGALGPRFGWRVPFLVVSIPALICALLVYLTVEDPERGRMEEAVRKHREQENVHNRSSESTDDTCLEMAPLDLSYKKEEEPPSRYHQIVEDEPKFQLRNHLESLAALLSTPTVLLCLMQGAPGCVPWGIVNTFLNDFLAQDRGMSVEYATFTIMIFGIGNGIGLIVGGTFGGYLYRWDKRYPCLLSGTMAILGCFPLWILLNNIDGATPFLKLGAVAILAGNFSGATGPIVKATLQNVTLPNARGQAFALFNTFDDFGRGLGPVFVSMLITSLGGRTAAFNVGVLGWMVCGIFNLCMFCSVEGDELYVQSTVAAILSTRQHQMSDRESG